MPPSAIESSAFPTSSVSPRRRRNSSVDAGGNIGAPPQPAHDVRPLLAVDLDADEVLVHQGGRLLVLERLVFHHVAPVAGGVPDREQNRLVLVARPPSRLLTPGVPVDRVVRVLQEVRARLGGQTVHAPALALARRQVSAAAVIATAMPNASRSA